VEFGKEGRKLLLNGLPRNSATNAKHGRSLSHSGLQVVWDYEHLGERFAKAIKLTPDNSQSAN
jgi:hypothetical protein